jgi:N utilization substance protein A
VGAVPTFFVDHRPVRFGFAAPGAGAIGSARQRMKNEFVTAITQLSAEKNLNSESVFTAVEAAMASAFKKDELQYAEIEVSIDRVAGDIEAWRTWAITDDDEIEDDEIQLSPERAKELGFGDTKIGDVVRLPIESTPQTGRIAAQTAKQVVLQRLREAERDSVFEDFTGKEGEIVSGTVLRVERGRQQVILDLGRTEAVLPYSEQIRAEHYRIGQRLRVYVKEVYRATRGPQVVVSRAAPELLRRLFELEVPEIARGTIEIMGVVREPGYRTKVAVISRQDGIDPIGAVVGVRGARIQNIVNELSGERIDVIRWDPNDLAYVANALSPAEVVSINLDDETNTMFLAVPDRQISLAIGKEGQNARLAAKLTGYRIDIRGEGSMITAGEDLYPPPEPNMEAIAVREHAAIPSTGEAVSEVHATPDLSDDGVAATAESIAAAAADTEDAVRLTPEQEILAEFVEEEAPESIAPAAPVEEPAAPTTPRSEDTGGLRFGDDIRERQIEEEEESQREAQPRRGRRGGAGGAAHQPARQPARPERRGRRPSFDEYEEDEIEAALHGDDFLDDEFDDESEDDDEA